MTDKPDTSTAAVEMWLNSYMKKFVLLYGEGMPEYVRLICADRDAKAEQLAAAVKAKEEADQQTAGLVRYLEGKAGKRIGNGSASPAVRQGARHS